MNVHATARLLVLTLLLLLAPACGSSDSMDATPNGVEPAPSGHARDLPRTAGEAAPAERRLSRNVTWYDGRKQRRVWIDPEQILEVEAGTRGRELIAAHAPEAVERTGLPRARRWSLPRGGADSEALARTLTRSAPDCRFSPAFFDGPSDQTSMRALTGRVIIKFPETWTDDQVGRWTEARDMEPVRSLGIGRHVLVFEAGEGMACLERANEIHEAGEVVWATPEWITAAAPRTLDRKDDR